MLTLMIAAALAAAQQAPDWGATARRDVLAAYDLYVADHPGMHNPGDKGFPARLAAARDAALAEARRTTDRGGYERALGLFSAGLADGHALLAPKDEVDSGTRLWPGFVAAWRGRLLVREAEAGSGLAAGDEIIGCDGRKAQAFIRYRLLADGFRAGEAGQWWARAHRAFDAYEADPGKPRSCLVRSGAGSRLVTLRWSPAPADINRRFRVSSDGQRSEIALTEPRPGLFLLGMPSFDPDAADSRAYERLFEAVGNRRGELLRARAVVIDLRHNDGGSSSWSERGAERLWGKEAVEARLAAYQAGASIWWRASAGNIGALRAEEAEFRSKGNDNIAADLARARAGLESAAARNAALWLDRDAAEPNPPPRSPRSDFATPVYVIVPGRCASACLDALDRFRLFPNVKLIGAPSSADSVYMEVRVADLPSGHGVAVIPMKFYAGRKRGSGAVYRPDIPVAALDWTTAAFLDRIEADLRK